jgi:hypothetical protein
MKNKSLFNVNIIHDSKTIVYLILPQIDNVTFEMISLTLEFLKKYKKIVYLCSKQDFSFFKFLFFSTKPLNEYKNIEIEIFLSFKLKEIFLQNCLIINLHNDVPISPNNKKAIFCSVKEGSDIIFKRENVILKLIAVDYLSNLLKFINIDVINDFKKPRSSSFPRTVWTTDGTFRSSP